MVDLCCNVLIGTRMGQVKTGKILVFECCPLIMWILFTAILTKSVMNLESSRLDGSGKERIEYDDQ